MATLHDMHCHLDFMVNGEKVAAAAHADGTLLFANTVTPAGWTAACERFAEFPNVTVGFGMHPWWVTGAAADESPVRRASSQRAEHKRLAEEAERRTGEDNLLGAQAQQAEVLAVLDEADPSIIGEIGLDFGWRHLASREFQLAMFSSIACWAAERGGRLVSLHSIKAARETLDVLESSGALESCRCVFHWFSGSSDLLKRAIDAGCFFSCGLRMLATGKGREYVKAIPAKQILLETDAPPEQGTPYPYADLRANLEHAALEIAAIKGEATLETIARTSEQLLDGSW